MPTKLKLSADGKQILDEAGKPMDAEIVNLNEVANSIATVDKEKIFTEHLKDKFSLDEGALKNINDVANRVRTEEKDKLYKELESHKKAAEDAKKAAEQLVKDKEALTKQLEEASKKKKDGKDDGEGAKELERLTKEIEAARNRETELKASMEDFRKTLLESIDKERAQEKITNYRSLKIAQANGQLIPELVVGATEAEIDLSVEKAKQRFAEIVKAAGGDPNKAAGGNNGQGNDGKGGSSLPINTQLNLNQGGIPQTLSVQDLKTMPFDEYAKRRKEIKEALKMQGKQA